MRVLWVCNFMLPAVAESLGLQPTNKEGWIAGLYSRLRQDKGSDVELGVCFPIPESLKKVYQSEDAEAPDLMKGSVDGAAYYGFLEDTVHLHFYDFKVERQLEKILQDFQPDLLHIFGTEYPHALAAAKAWRKPERTLVGLQGIMTSCAEAYFADLPEKVIRRFTLRDWLKRDNILEQQEKFKIRAEQERQLLKLTAHVTGRTAFDRAAAEQINQTLSYHLMNETMRSNFYEGEGWSLEGCERHSLFVSQGNYPLKGLHKVIEALPIVKDLYPDVKLYVAGDLITACRTWKDKLKISSYGKYLLDLMNRKQCAQAVSFLGKLDAQKMRQRFLRSHVFVSASSMENSSNSVGEAMLLGVPVVASRVGGLPSMMEDGQECLFYEFSDVNALARRIIRIFEDDELALALSEKARVRAAGTHDPDRNLARLLEIYQEIQNL